MAESEQQAALGPARPERAVGIETCGAARLDRHGTCPQEGGLLHRLLGVVE